jgi:phage-related protein
MLSVKSSTNAVSFIKIGDNFCQGGNSGLEVAQSSFQVASKYSTKLLEVAQSSLQFT